MSSVPHHLRELIDENPLLQLGLRERLLNLSQTARYIQGALRARVGKKVSPGAILMGLSRIQREVGEISPGPQFKLKNLSVQSGLIVLTYPKTLEIHRSLNALHGRAKAPRALSITEGVSEITVIIEANNEKQTREALEVRPKTIRRDVAALTVKFDEQYLDVPGFLCFVLLQLYFQNINIVELASTSTELIVYLSESEVRLAFDTIYHRFVQVKS